MKGERAGQQHANGIGMVQCWCPAGRFLMGSPEDEPGRSPDEKQMETELMCGFWLGKYPVTQGEYQTLIRETPSRVGGDEWVPVTDVSWYEATRFCRVLTQHERASGNLPGEGWAYRLPTGAQWEYACRAGTTGSLNSGKELTRALGRCPNLDELGWYKENSAGSAHAVGDKAPNRWGIHDMHGNVVEWCSDPFAGTWRSGCVLRGGSWESAAGQCRSASRLGEPRTIRRACIGFRVALCPSGAAE